MRKSKEQIEAELIVAKLLRDNNVEKVLDRIKYYEEQRKYAIAQRVTVAIVLCTLWDFYKEMTEQDIKEFYDYYLAYHKSFNEGAEDIYKQMVAIDEMLGGELMKEEYFNAIKEKANE